MFSNDRNIETIGQLAESLKQYFSLQGEYVKLSVVEKTVRVLTAIFMMVILGILLLGIVLFLSFAAAYALEPYLGSVGAFALVAGFYLLVLLLFLVFRKQWVERPLVKFLASLLLSGERDNI
ncbi:MAG: phage holin family protein [Prevotella sp.]|jgi:polyferredoxin